MGRVGAARRRKRAHRRGGARVGSARRARRRRCGAAAAQSGATGATCLLRRNDALRGALCAVLLHQRPDFLRAGRASAPAARRRRNARAGACSARGAARLRPKARIAFGCADTPAGPRGYARADTLARARQRDASCRGCGVACAICLGARRTRVLPIWDKESRALPARCGRRTSRCAASARSSRSRPSRSSALRCCFSALCAWAANVRPGSLLGTHRFG